MMIEMRTGGEYNVAMEHEEDAWTLRRYAEFADWEMAGARCHRARDGAAGSSVETPAAVPI
jgi:hypothetical protein